MAATLGRADEAKGRLTTQETVIRKVRAALASCQHANGCPGVEADARACLPQCPDRERRSSLLVILARSRTSTTHLATDEAYLDTHRDELESLSLSALEDAADWEQRFREWIQR